LWPPCGIGQAIIFSPCGFFLLSSSFFSRLISAAAHWMSTILRHIYGVALVRIENAGLKRAARGSLEMQDSKNCQKLAICAPSHNFVGLYLRNEGTYRQSEKNLLSNNISSTCPHNMVNFGPLAAEIVWGHPCKFQRVSRLGSVTARHCTSGRQPNFAALNTGRHIYSARRPSRLALAHISSSHMYRY